MHTIKNVAVLVGNAFYILWLVMLAVGVIALRRCKAM